MMAINSVAVLGAGTMGAQIALHCANAGLPVLLLDLTADELHLAWPEAEYIVVPDAGHSVWEPSVSATVVAEVDRMKLHLAR